MMSKNLVHLICQSLDIITTLKEFYENYTIIKSKNFFCFSSFFSNRSYYMHVVSIMFGSFTLDSIDNKMCPHIFSRPSRCHEFVSGSFSH